MKKGLGLEHPCKHQDHSREGENHSQGLEDAFEEVGFGFCILGAKGGRIE